MPHGLYGRSSVYVALAATFLGWTAFKAAASSTAFDLKLVAAASAVTDATGSTWSPDGAYAQGGTLASTDHAISGALAGDQVLYQHERYGLSGYRIPVPGKGTYRVQLHESENYWWAPGQRVFSVLAEGKAVVSDLDVEKAAGQYAASTQTFTVKVTDGQLNLSFPTKADLAKVDSLEVSGLGIAPARIPLPTPAPTLSTTPTPVPTPSPAASSTPTVSPSAAAPTASPSSAAPVVPTGTVLTPEQFGAVGDGRTDDTSALQAAFDAAKDGKTVSLTRTYAHDDVLHLRTAGMTVSGGGTLLATAEKTSSVWIEADRVTVSGITVRTASTTQRWSAWEQMGIRLLGQSGITLRNVDVVGSAAAGVYVGGASNFVLDHVHVTDTRADGIHMTQGSHDGKVISPVITNSGDDGVAVVSYGADGPACHDITVTSPTVLGTSGGRGLSVVGGSNVTETDIHVERSAAAAVYIAAEGDPWYSASPTNVLFDGGTISGANTDSSIDHGAVLVLAGESDKWPQGVVVRGLTISGTRASASRDVGVITYGTAPTGVELDDLTITGGPSSAYQGNSPDNSYTTRRWTQDGKALPDHTS